MAKPKHCQWWVCSDSWAFVYYRPTVKSAHRLAKRMAAELGQTFYYHTAKARRKARAKNKLIKVFVVEE